VRHFSNTSSNMVDNSCETPSRESISHAYSIISRHVRRTPLLVNSFLDQIASSPNPHIYLPNLHVKELEQDSTPAAAAPQFNLFFKAENLQYTGAFKVRGAFYALQRLVDNLGLLQVQKIGVVTHSSGNHAQALAYASSTFDIPSYIVMPQGATRSKVEGARRFAKEIVFARDSTAEERTKTMRAVQDRTKAIFVPPFDHPDIISGQGTVALEMSEQFHEFRVQDKRGEHPGDGPDFDAVAAPLGGGGLLSGIATWYHTQRDTRVYGAEPNFEGADDGKRGREQGVRIELVDTHTIADGLRMPVGINNFRIISDTEKVEQIYTVGEEYIKGAMRVVLEQLKVVAEPSACVPLAMVLFNKEFRDLALKAQMEQGGRAWNICIVLSGGNTTVEKISEILGG
jgi:threonine dehydratase